MSSGGSIECVTASGGHDWLFSDPFAYQYSDIPHHVRDIHSRSQSPASTGSAVCELEGSLPTKQEDRSPAESEHFELEGSSLIPPTFPGPRRCSTSPPSPETKDTAGLSPMDRVPASLLTGPQRLPVLDHINHGEIVRNRHANVRLSRRYPSHHRRMMTESSLPSTTIMDNHLASRADTLPDSPGWVPMEAKIPQIRRLLPIRTDMHYEPGLMPADGFSSSTASMPKKDFDSILRDIEPSPKKGKWRHSRAIQYQDKYGTWGA